jgi:carboxypeptidase family protein
MLRSFTLVLLLTPAAWAQSTATIHGTVSDKAGAVVPGVAVTVTQVETGITRAVKSDAAGGYVFVQLPVGHFMLNAQTPGFKEYRESPAPRRISWRSTSARRHLDSQ